MNKKLDKLSRSKNRTPGSLWSSGEKKGLLLTGVIVVLALLTYLGYPVIKSQANQNSLNDLYNQKLPINKVCMYGDDIKFKVIRPVNIEGKTYWACCNKCEAKLKRNLNDCLNTIDPYSNEKISKADAVIVQNPEKKGKVLFFKSYNNYEKHLAENNIKLEYESK
jgi:YHS domain-containing protein